MTQRNLSIARRAARVGALLAALISPIAPALAQIRLPSLPGAGRLPTLPDPLSRTSDLLRQAEQTLAPLDLAPLRQRLGDTLLRRHPKELRRNAAGELVFVGEVLAMPSSPRFREALLAVPGLRLVEERRMDELDLSWLRLRREDADSADAATLDALIERLRAADPDGAYDFHHVYLGAGDAQPAATNAATNAASLAGSAAVGPAASEPRVGMIDSGVDDRHPALRETPLTRQGCDGRARPAAHGTAVAALLAGRADGFQGAAPRARLFAVDIYCEGGDRAGGGALAVAQGLDWLLRERVGVVNISLVGPPNALLRRAVDAALARGLVIVAPVSNDGPAAPPLYPAAWPGVVGVTGVDARRRVLAEAGRGPQVMFAAPGADLASAVAGSRGYGPVRGTSFASPLVAGLLAPRRPRLDTPGETRAALDALAAQAQDLGAPGRDEVYGFGLIGEALRVSPRDLPGPR